MKTDTKATEVTPAETADCCGGMGEECEHHHAGGSSINESKTQKTIKMWRGLALIMFGLVILSQVFSVSVRPKSWVFRLVTGGKTADTSLATAVSSAPSVDTSALEQEVLPAGGVVLPITWGSIGKQMVADGVIDETKFRALFQGGFDNQDEQMLSGSWNDQVVMTPDNSRFMLDLLWAFGLGNKNDILDHGEMTDPQYGGADKFAATGGWSLAKGPAMDHYSHHNYVTLSAEQQALVDKVSRNIYRPCCGNSTHFPDCNHGMAMLGLLELMAKNGANEDQMYQVALAVNSYWFPQTYMDLATYFKEQGKDWNQVDAKTVLGQEYSSAQGYQVTREKIQSLPEPAQGGGGCGA